MRQTEEIWKSIKDFSDYEVSNLGRIRSNKVHWKDSHIMAGLLTGWGYYNIILCRQEQIFMFSIRHLVLEAFVGPCPSGYEANHKNGIKTDDKAENLEWISHGENMAHAFETGLRSLKGESHSRAKLKNKDILRIRKLAELNIKKTVIAKIFKISAVHVGSIVHRRSWNHI